MWKITGDFPRNLFSKHNLGTTVHHARQQKAEKKGFSAFSCLHNIIVEFCDWLMSTDGG
jgi:hypothetical protein